MKKIFVLTLIFLLFNSVWAQDVNRKTIEKVALSAFKQSIKKANLKVDPVIDTVLTYSDETGPLLYIVNFKSKGFVIVSSDYSISPTLGGSINTNFSFDDAPGGLKYLLKKYVKQTQELKKLKNKQTFAKKKDWDKLMAMEEPPIDSIPEPDPDPIPLPEIPNMINTF